MSILGLGLNADTDGRMDGGRTDGRTDEWRTDGRTDVFQKMFFSLF